ncbi:MAG TPA: hypothetical protein VK921_01215 [Anditalea sp.]|nr:hypothetical protein [Anditalea sp.]
MFKHFFKKVNSDKPVEEQGSEVQTNPQSYQEICNTLNISREGSILNRASISNDQSDNEKLLITENIEVIELENVLHIKGPAKDLQRIADDIQSMEFLAPGDQYVFGEWRFLVTDYTIISSKEEKFIALPPDEWLMMGCKFNDAISGYDLNPYTFFSSPFGSYKLPYGIEIFVTDIMEEEEDNIFNV